MFRYFKTVLSRFVVRPSFDSIVGFKIPPKSLREVGILHCFCNPRKGFLQMDRYGNYYYQGSGLWRSLRDGDFEESEVWDVLRERKDQSLPGAVADRYALTHVPSAARMVPPSSNSSGSSSSTFAHQSAPVNIPNWSDVQKRLGRSKSSKAPRTRQWRDDDDDDDDGEDDNDNDDDEDDDAYGDPKVPPHEHIAMRLARSKVSSFSVLEGVGRKLKGRDLSKVRNDVLTKTGFLESP